jgi:hypothetical protein
MQKDVEVQIGYSEVSVSQAWRVMPDGTAGCADEKNFQYLTKQTAIDPFDSFMPCTKAFG